MVTFPTRSGARRLVSVEDLAGSGAIRGPLLDRVIASAGIHGDPVGPRLDVENSSLDVLLGIH